MREISAENTVLVAPRKGLPGQVHEISAKCPRSTLPGHTESSLLSTSPHRTASTPYRPPHPTWGSASASIAGHCCTPPGSPIRSTERCNRHTLRPGARYGPRPGPAPGGGWLHWGGGRGDGGWLQGGGGEEGRTACLRQKHLRAAGRLRRHPPPASPFPCTGICASGGSPPPPLPARAPPLSFPHLPLPSWAPTSSPPPAHTGHSCGCTGSASRRAGCTAPRGLQGRGRGRGCRRRAAGGWRRAMRGQRGRGPWADRGCRRPAGDEVGGQGGRVKGE